MNQENQLSAQPGDKVAEKAVEIFKEFQETKPPKKLVGEKLPLFSVPEKHYSAKFHRKRPHQDVRRLERDQFFEMPVFVGGPSDGKRYHVPAEHDHFRIPEDPPVMRSKHVEPPLDTPIRHFTNVREKIATAERTFSFMRFEKLTVEECIISLLSDYERKKK